MYMYVCMYVWYCYVHGRTVTHTHTQVYIWIHTSGVLTTYNTHNGATYIFHRVYLQGAAGPAWLVLPKAVYAADAGNGHHPTAGHGVLRVEGWRMMQL